jgi:catechol 2,3-dioxygenase-like lactoylglutathione lyase family enzyme
MLTNSQAFSGFAVDDLDKAREFYGEVLGIKVTEENGLLTLHLAGGDRPTLIYPKPDVEPGNYTILNFQVEDIDAAVAELASRGVVFEHYEGFDQEESGISRAQGGPPIAWFKDPAGHILSVLQNN